MISGRRLSVLATLATEVYFYRESMMPEAAERMACRPIAAWAFGTDTGRGAVCVCARALGAYKRDVARFVPPTRTLLRLLWNCHSPGHFE